MDKSIPELAAEFHCLCHQMEELHGSQIISLINTTQENIKAAIRTNRMLMHSYSYELKRIKNEDDNDNG
ncbi:hypothetical protein [Providencia rettgeri]|uniref:hypothetical protein n=1 Tax=Providencia rettgeri TaxID=587 RepID=UPI0018C6CC0B|nr:hypothetical protein [Providencia rettgeri]MBG5926096.1 hypothetical protein [Providencia rettgeri]